MLYRTSAARSVIRHTVFVQLGSKIPDVIAYSLYLKGHPFDSVAIFEPQVEVKEGVGAFAEMVILRIDTFGGRRPGDGLRLPGAVGLSQLFDWL